MGVICSTQGQKWIFILTSIRQGNTLISRPTWRIIFEQSLDKAVVKIRNSEQLLRKVSWPLWWNFKFHKKRTFLSRFSNCQVLYQVVCLFVCLFSVQTGSGAHPASNQWIPGALSPGVKRPGREADHSPSSSAEMKNAWRYTSTPQYVFMAERTKNKRWYIYVI